jgi:hypothetical protein
MIFKLRRVVALVSVMGVLAFGMTRVAGVAAEPAAGEPAGASDTNIPAGAGRILPAYTTFRNPAGTLGVLNTAGPIDTRSHPFFQPLGSNGRACVTCHQPADGMSLSIRTISRQWEAAGAKDSLFAQIDGANCPNLPAESRASHSLLLDKGLFRISMPWPPKDIHGHEIATEFDIKVVSDPTGCNSDPVYGLQSKNPRVSVFRRPRPAANMKYVEPETPLSLWHIRTGEVRPVNPATGHRLGGNLMSDSRADTLIAQMIDASRTHMAASADMSAAEQEKVQQFLFQVFVAQVADSEGGSLKEGGGFLGPEALRDGKPAVVGAYSARPMFPEIEGWITRRVAASLPWRPLVKLPPFPATRVNEERESPQQRSYRDSVARGYLSFVYRQFLIRNVADLNGFIGNPVKQTCAACHNMVQTGMDVAPGYLDIGTTTYRTAVPAPDLPLFKIDCRRDSPPHPYLGREIYTTDPGRALVTGRCADIGKVVVQQMRGLAARAPYFAGGSAPDLRAVVKFYDARFNIGYSEQEIADLVKFMEAL